MQGGKPTNQRWGAQKGIAVVEKHSIDIQVGARLTELREQLNIEVARIALALNVSVERIHAYEAGADRISAADLQKIATIFGVKATEFFTGIPRNADLALAELSAEAHVPVEEALEFLRVFRRIANASARRHLINYAEMLAANSTDDGTS